MKTEELASGAALYRLNKEGLLPAAVERSSAGVVDRNVACELLADYFAEHPEEQKPRRGPASRSPSTRARKAGGELEKLARWRVARGLSPRYNPEDSIAHRVGLGGEMPASDGAEALHADSVRLVVTRVDAPGP